MRLLCLFSIVFLAAVPARAEQQLNNPGMMSPDHAECQALQEVESHKFGLTSNAKRIWTRCVQIDQDDYVESVSLFTIPDRILDGPPAALLPVGVARPGFTVPRAVLVLVDDDVHGMGAHRIFDLPLHGGDVDFENSDVVIGDLTGDGVREILLPLIRSGWVAVIDPTQEIALRWLKLGWVSPHGVPTTVEVLERNRTHQQVPEVVVYSAPMHDALRRETGQLGEVYMFLNGEFQFVRSFWRSQNAAGRSVR